MSFGPCPQEDPGIPISFANTAFRSPHLTRECRERRVSPSWFADLPSAHQRPDEPAFLTMPPVSRFVRHVRCCHMPSHARVERAFISGGALLHGDTVPPSGIPAGVRFRLSAPGHFGTVSSPPSRFPDPVAAIPYFGDLSRTSERTRCCLAIIHLITVRSDMRSVAFLDLRRTNPVSINFSNGGIHQH